MLDNSVDVIIPVYNRSELALEAVKNVLNQSHNIVRITVVNDASNTTETKLLEEGLHNLSQSIRLISLDHNYGPAEARNRGAANGNAEYLAFLDSDDLWHPDKLAQQLHFMKKYQEIGYVHTNETWFRNGERIKPKKIHLKEGGYFIKRLLERCLISASAILFRRSFWNKLPEHFNPAFRVAEDYEFWLRLNLLHPAGYIDEPLTIKRAGNWSQLSSTIEIDRQRVLALHRFYRLNKNNNAFLAIKTDWKNEILRKTGLLIKGAVKHNRPRRAATYRAWLKLFEKL